MCCVSSRLLKSSTKHIWIDKTTDFHAFTILLLFGKNQTRKTLKKYNQSKVRLQTDERLVFISLCPVKLTYLTTFAPLVRILNIMKDSKK